MQSDYVSSQVTFQPPVLIGCTVKGKKLDARILAECSDDFGFGFEVAFSDGTHFITMDNDLTDRLAITNPAHQAYLDAINDDLQCLMFVRNTNWYMFEISHEKPLRVWVSESEEPDYRFSVYYNAEYHFSIDEKNGQWCEKNILTTDPKVFDKSIAEKVTRELQLKINL